MITFRHAALTDAKPRRPDRYDRPFVGVRYGACAAPVGDYGVTNTKPVVTLFLLNPPFFLDVANDPWFVPGFLMLIMLYLVGFFTIRKMVDLKV